MLAFLESLFQEGQSFSPLEILAVLSALLYVFLASKANRWCFLFGLISSIIYVYLCTILKLYFDTFINAYYIVMSFYGWFAWKTAEDKPIKIKIIKAKHFYLIIISGIIITLALALFATSYTDADLPYLDAFTTVFSIIATWMVVKKYLSNWLLWIVVDAVAASMYWYKELYLTSLLFLLYTIIAFNGYYKWSKIRSNDS